MSSSKQGPPEQRHLSEVFASIYIANFIWNVFVNFILFTVSEG